MFTRSKQFLKQIALFRRANAALKNVQLEWRSRHMARTYAQRLRTPVDVSISHARGMVAARMASAGVTGLQHLNRPPTLFLVGTEYEQERAGFIQGLSKWGPVVPLQTAEGRYGLRPSVGTFDRATIEENSRQLIEQVDAARLQRPIDLLIGTMVAQYVSASALQHVRTKGIPVLNIAMDDRLSDHWGTHGGVRLGAIGLAHAVDLVLQTTAEYVPRYLIEGCPAVFWPFGSDPDWFRPSSDKRYDVCFVGNNYGWRSELIRQIEASGVQVQSYGRGFPNGHINAEGVARVLGESRIVLGVGTVAHSKRIVTLKLRDFDGPMSGSLYVTTDNPDLHGLFAVGTEIVTYSSPRHCVRLLEYYLQHDEEREAIAAAGRRRAVRDHTWERRVGEALELIGLRQ
jgi:spore maturation protein CgeB